MIQAARSLSELANREFGREFDLTTVLGGSAAKGTADRFSDLDITIVYRSRFSSAALGDEPGCLSGTLRSWRDRFGRIDRVSTVTGVEADVHLVEASVCQNAITGFAAALDLSNAVQELLWPLQNGIAFVDGELVVPLTVQFPERTRVAIFHKFTGVLGFHKLAEMCERRDYLQIDESKLTIRKCLLCLGYAARRELFWGFKSSQQIYWALPVTIRQALQAVDQCTDQNWPERIRDLDKLFARVRTRIKRLSEVGDAVI